MAALLPAPVGEASPLRVPPVAPVPDVVAPVDAPPVLELPTASAALSIVPKMTCGFMLASM